MAASLCPASLRRSDAPQHTRRADAVVLPVTPGPDTLGQPGGLLKLIAGQPALCCKGQIKIGCQPQRREDMPSKRLVKIGAGGVGTPGDGIEPAKQSRAAWKPLGNLRGPIASFQRFFSLL